MTAKTTGINVIGTVNARYQEVLTSEAFIFIEELERNFGKRRVELLQYRQKRQEELNNGKQLIVNDEFAKFLTLPGYDFL